jgi:hypothetical protein
LLSSAKVPSLAARMPNTVRSRSRRLMALMCRPGGEFSPGLVEGIWERDLQICESHGDQLVSDSRVARGDDRRRTRPDHPA